LLCFFETSPARQRWFVTDAAPQRGTTPLRERKMLTKTVTDAPACSKEQFSEAVLKAKEGCRESMGLLFASVETYLLTIAKQSLSKQFIRRVSPEDIVQSAMLSLCRSFSFHGETIEEFAVWCAKSVRHDAMDTNERHRSLKRNAYKERRVGISAIEQPLPESETPEQIAIDSEEFQVVLCCMENLPEKQCEAVRLYYLEGLGVQEVADQMGSTYQSTKGRIKRGLKGLREAMVD
jgi:RNA polymerase sigma factor (sigma-70 family)